MLLPSAGEQAPYNYGIHIVAARTSCGTYSTIVIHKQGGHQRQQSGGNNGKGLPAVQLKGKASPQWLGGTGQGSP